MNLNLTFFVGSANGNCHPVGNIEIMNDLQTTNRTDSQEEQKNVAATPHEIHFSTIPSHAGASSSSSSRHGATATSSIRNSVFADHLLSQLGKGAESCAGLQQAAAAMVIESGGNCSNITKRMASIGSCGKHPRNCERDLFRLMDLPVVSWISDWDNFAIQFSFHKNISYVLPTWSTLGKEPVFVRVPIKDKSKPKGHVKYLRCPVVLPHELLHHCASTKQVVVSAQEIRDYWAHWSKYKPPHEAATLSQHAPVGLGGDDARYTLAGAKVIVICMNNLLWDLRCRANQSKDLLVDSPLKIIVSFRKKKCLIGVFC